MNDYYIDQINEILTFGNYSPNTVKTYKTYVRPFLEYCESVLRKDPADISDSELRAFVLQIQKDRNLSDRTTNHILSELRFFYETVLDQDWNPRKFPMRKFEHRIPYVPSKQVVQEFISYMPDIKAKAMVVLMYSAGLRVTEVCRLKCSDIQHDLHRIYVAPSKNNHDRYTVLSEEAYTILRAYWNALPPKFKTYDWLFTRQRSLDNPIYPQFVQNRILQYEKELGWPHKLHCHSFRHAFATHSIQAGMDIETLARLLGHRSISSTNIYIDLSTLSMDSIPSPMDGMEV